MHRFKSIACRLEEDHFSSSERGGVVGNSFDILVDDSIPEAEHVNRGNSRGIN